MIKKNLKIFPKGGGGFARLLKINAGPPWTLRPVTAMYQCLTERPYQPGILSKEP